MYTSFLYMSLSKGQSDTSSHDITMLGLNFSEGKANPVIIIGRKERYPEEWNLLLASITETRQIYLNELNTDAPNNYSAIEHASKAISYRLLSDPAISSKEMIIVIHLRQLEFQVGQSAAIFVDHRGLRHLLESHLGQRLDDKTAERLLYPSGVISVIREGLSQSMVDAITFVNDPISYFVMRRLAELTLLNRQRLRVYFIDVMANRRMMSGGECMTMISILERLKVSKGPTG